MSMQKKGTIPAIGMKPLPQQQGSPSSSAPYSAGTLEQLKRRRHNIHVMFLSTQKDDHMLNRVTAMIGERIHQQGFCHVEICIPDLEAPALPNGQPSGYLSSSIYNGEKVTLTKTKTFANPGEYLSSGVGILSGFSEKISS